MTTTMTTTTTTTATTTATTTERWTLTLGVTPGYGHANEGAADETAAFLAAVEAGKAAAARVQDELGVYPSFVTRPVRVGYRTEWGCPLGGEFALVYEGTRNPDFCPDPDAYAAAWRRLAELLKEEFRQTTATLEVACVGLIYLK